jgi:hypothetical protein
VARVGTSKRRGDKRLPERGVEGIVGCGGPDGAIYRDGASRLYLRGLLEGYGDGPIRGLRIPRSDAGCLP